MTFYDTEIKSQSLDLDLQGWTGFVSCLLFLSSLLKLFPLLTNLPRFVTLETLSRFVIFGVFVVLFSEP